MDSLPTLDDFLREGRLDAHFDFGGVLAASGYHEAGPWLFAFRLGDPPGQVYRMASQVDGVESVGRVLTSALAKWARERADASHGWVDESHWSRVLRGAEDVQQLRAALVRAGLETPSVE